MANEMLQSICERQKLLNEIFKNYFVKKVLTLSSKLEVQCVRHKQWNAYLVYGPGTLAVATATS